MLKLDFNLYQRLKLSILLLGEFKLKLLDSGSKEEFKENTKLEDYQKEILTSMLKTEMFYATTM